MIKAEVVFSNNNSIICNNYLVFRFGDHGWYVEKNYKKVTVKESLLSAIRYCMEN